MVLAAAGRSRGVRGLGQYQTIGGIGGTAEVKERCTHT